MLWFDWFFVPLGTRIASQGLWRMETMVKNIFIAMILVFGFLMGCEEEATDTAVDNLPAPVISDGSSAKKAVEFEESVFSPYLEFSPDKSSLRIAFSFFPDGSGFDFEAQTVAIPCAFLNLVPEGVDVQLSAPLEDDCKTPTTISFGDAGESFTLDGIVVPFDKTYAKFGKDFELLVSEGGMEDTSDGTLLFSENGGLEDFYKLLLARRVAAQD